MTHFWLGCNSKICLMLYKIVKVKYVENTKCSLSTDRSSAHLNPERLSQLLRLRQNLEFLDICIAYIIYKPDRSAAV